MYNHPPEGGVKQNEVENTKNEKQRAIHNVVLCTFCEKEIIEIELTYTEDVEPSHIKCSEDFNKHWEDRDEMMGLMGY